MDGGVSIQELQLGAAEGDTTIKDAQRIKQVQDYMETDSCLESR